MNRTGTLTISGTPTPRQRAFFMSTARHTAYGGARGGGKSWALRRKLVLLAFAHENLNMLLLRRTYGELDENHVLPLRRELGGFVDYDKAARLFTFPTGSRIKLGYCENEDDVYRYQGQEYEVICLEEATHFSQAQMKFITTCNRTARRDFRPRMYYTCNPGGVGHDWVKRLFIDRDYADGEHAEDYAFIPARVYDNVYLTEADPGYVKVLEALPEKQRRAYLDGDWDVLAGQYFPEFSRERHVVEPFELPVWYRRFCSMDWGYRDPTCVLWHAMDMEGRVITYRELYVNNMLAGEVARRVRVLSEGEKIEYTVASPDMWHKRGGLIEAEGGRHGECLAEVFALAGVPLIPADNNRVAGWMRVREYLGDGAAVRGDSAAGSGDPALRGQNAARWRCFSCCCNLIRTLPKLQYDNRSREDAAQGDDHAPEALRYGLMSRPGRSEMKKTVRREKGPLEY